MIQKRLPILSKAQDIYDKIKNLYENAFKKKCLLNLFKYVKDNTVPDKRKS